MDRQAESLPSHESSRRRSSHYLALALQLSRSSAALVLDLPLAYLIPAPTCLVRVPTTAKVSPQSPLVGSRERLGFSTTFRTFFFTFYDIHLPPLAAKAIKHPTALWKALWHFLLQAQPFFVTPASAPSKVHLPFPSARIDSFSR
ncbi:hypothetical protein BKA64DRAFT_236535 [Cadophora sp. MPI-SDFR-AT-0126]|nr:hypothetical protein BKA64DRAFT_236535 [Leotiomycetes sp. MPI-SDFR-AT-0126]